MNGKDNASLLQHKREKLYQVQWNSEMISLGHFTWNIIMLGDEIGVYKNKVFSFLYVVTSLQNISGN